MPKDDWRRSEETRTARRIERQKLGSGGGPHRETSTKAANYLWDKAVNGQPKRYVIPTGVQCIVRKIGTDKWQTKTTSRMNKFTSAYYERTNFIVFRRDGWEMAVEKQYIQ